MSSRTDRALQRNPVWKHKKEKEREREREREREKEKEKERVGFKSEGEGLEMAQWLRALTALPEVLSSIPSNHMGAHNHL